MSVIILLFIEHIAEIQLFYDLMPIDTISLSWRTWLKKTLNAT